MLRLSNGWEVKISSDAKKDFQKLDGSLKKQVIMGILKVSKAPLPSPHGYGKPLGNKSRNDLTGFFKIKYKGIGIRVIYTLVLKEAIMNIVVISDRDDNYCYELAAKAYKKYGEKLFEDIFENSILE